jgi:hypothetical protein
MGKAEKKKKAKKAKKNVPRTIFFIRHGEKPQKSEETGKLSAIGRQRSFHLQLHGRRWKPKMLFATKPRPPRVGEERPRSARMIETLQPFIEEWQVPVNAVNTEHQVDDVKGLVKTIRNLEPEINPILVCWAHEHIPSLVKPFLTRKQDLKWDSNEYDQVWVVSRGKVRVENQGFVPEDTDPTESVPEPHTTTE